LAQATSPDITAWLIGTPVTVLAFGIVAFIRGWIVTAASLERCQRKLDAAEAELRNRNQETISVIVPIVTRCTEIMARQLERYGDTPPPPTKGGR
jgi:tetrahydromethanopterin S-methyltransferase subunit E